MRWSLELGMVAGIRVRVHASFAILLAWVALGRLVEEGTAAAAIGGILFTLTIFGTIILHELGHALMARRFGYRTRDITLLPIGGLARLDRLPEEPRQELLVALAGPAVNVAIAACLAALLLAVGGEVLPPLDGASRVPFGAALLWTNVGIAVFNMIPAFPMDGGRVLRALLAMRLGFLPATQVAAAVGRSIALLFGAAGLVVNPFLVLIALFVWFAAGQEASLARLRSTLRDIPVRAALIEEVRTLAPDDLVGEAARAALAGFQRDFPVVDDDERLLGLLTREELVSALARGRLDAPVASVMRAEVRAARPDEKLEAAIMRLGPSDGRTIPVVEEGRLAGVVTLDQIEEILVLETAARAAEPAAAA
jgi:Zn-dependent protease